MKLEQLQTALLILDDSLSCFDNSDLFSTQQNGTFFIQDRCCHLMMCLHVMEPHLGSFSPSFFYNSLSLSLTLSLILQTQCSLIT